MNLRPALLLASLLCSCGSDSTTEGPQPATSPESSSRAPAWLEDQASARGLVFLHESGHDERFFFPELMGGGAALFDMDGDGDLDAFCVQSGSLNNEEGARHQLFANDGQGRFEDTTEQAGLGPLPGYGQGVTAGDLNGDGAPDLYVTQVGRNLLLLGDGQGGFRNASADSGADDPGWGTSACLLDYDQDGDLDIFVANYVSWSLATEQDCFDPTGLPDYCGPTAYDAPSVDALLRNDGDGRFTNVTAAAGIAAKPGNGLGCVPGDFDGDGDLDLFVANDQSADRLWINQGDGSFIDRGEVAGVALSPYGGPRAGMGVDACDVDGDDDLDLFVVHMAREHDGFYRNRGRFFVEETAKVGIGASTFAMTRFGVGFHDFDLDGHLDLFVANGRVNMMLAPVSERDRYAEPNSLLQGQANGRWKAVEPLGGTATPEVWTSRGAAFGDVDGDGAQDILVINRDAPAQLLCNVTQQRGHWLCLRLVDGPGDALGASARLTLDGHTQRRDCKPHYSYCSSSDPRLTFGLGGETSAPEVLVRWLDGSEEAFGALAADQVHSLVRGQGRER